MIWNLVIGIAEYEAADHRESPLVCESATGESSNGHPYADMPPHWDAKTCSTILQRRLHLWKTVARETTENCPCRQPLGDTTEKLDSLVNLLNHFLKIIWGGGQEEVRVLYIKCIWGGLGKHVLNKCSWCLWFWSLYYLAVQTIPASVVHG